MMINQSQGDTIEVGHAVRTVAGRWRVVVASVIVGAALAAAVVKFAPRRYSAVGTLMLKSPSMSTGSSLLSQVTGRRLTYARLTAKTP